MRYFDASTAAELEPVALVLNELHRNATRCGVEIMVVGAAARDILIRHVVGSAPQRATADIDIAAAVASWPDIQRLTAVLTPGGSVHRFLVGGVEVDIIPFGEIESEQRTITWSNDHRMNVFGFREAMAGAVQVRLTADLVVAVASLPAQSLLKLFAWRDRRLLDRRDAIDLRSIICAYHEGPYLSELYEKHEALLVDHGFDPLLAGAERMGREANSLIAAQDQSVVTDLLFSEELFGLLATEMGRGHELLLAYRKGFRS